MATPHEISQPTLKFAYRLEINVDDPVVIFNGPRGSRFCIPVLNGTFCGAQDFLDGNFHGEIVSPSSDFAIGHADGSGVSLKVNVVMKLNDGATVLGVVEGRSDWNPANPTNAKIHSSKTFETGDDHLRWMNNQVFVGYGKKDGNKLFINYYQITDKL